MDALDPRHPLLQADALAARLRLYDLTEEDLALAERLHKTVIQPRLDDLAGTFYQRLFAKPQLDEFVHDRRTRERLLGTFRQYLATLGVDFTSADYAHGRIRVGLRHAQIGLPLTYYLGAYRILQDLLVGRVLQLDQAPESLVPFVLKITGYDTDLAVEAYHLLRTHLLEDSIEDLRQEKDKLTVAANTDALTRLANRRFILQQLETRCREAELRGRPMCLAMVDIDDFKAINDRHGHLCGDQVLAGLARTLSLGLRGNDAIGRYGGEEFMIILTGTDLLQASRVLERLREGVEKTPVRYGDTLIRVRLSAGLVQRAPGESCTRLIERADSALYEAKRAGKNRVHAATGQGAGAAGNNQDRAKRP